MKQYKKIVFICQDNTCRSVMAEAIMRNVQENLPMEQRLQVTSRGLVVLFPEPLNPKAVAVIRNNHIETVKTSSRALEENEVVDNTLFLTMTEREKSMMEERYPGASNFYTLREFVGEQGDINEPYGGTMEDYEMVYEHIDLMVKMVAQKMIKTEDE